jgi:hypothetical protein
MSDTFDRATAIAESRQLLADTFLRDPETGEDLFIIDAYENPDNASVSLVCVTDIDSTRGIVHTIYTGFAEKQTEKSDEVIYQEPKLVDLNGQVLK